MKVLPDEAILLKFDGISFGYHEQTESGHRRMRAGPGGGNGLHWILDVVSREDECRIRKGYGAENVSRLRKFALNQHNKENSTKAMSLRRKRKRCGRSMSYLLQTLLA